MAELCHYVEPDTTAVVAQHETADSPYPCGCGQPQCVTGAWYSRCHCGAVACAGGTYDEAVGALLAHREPTPTKEG